MAEEDTQSVLDMPDEEFLAREAELTKETPSTPSSEDTDDTSSTSPVQDNQEEEEEVDYKAFYDEVTAPFTANGQQISAKNSKEVISLMQKGTDYTRKTQQLSANRRVIDFLQRQQLLDENKLEMLADIANGNKKAIKKLIKDKQIDLMDLEDFDDDNDKDSYYVPQAKMPSQAAMVLNDTVADIASRNSGMEMLRNIQRTYDPGSISLIEQNPQILQDLYAHNVNGSYTAIKNEVDRRVALNQLNPNNPFLVNYASVMTEMSRNNPNNVVTQPYMGNGANGFMGNQIRGAKSTSSHGNRNTTRKVVNFLEMSDEDFIKQYGESNY